MADKKEKAAPLITPTFRLSYPSLFVARKVNQNDPNEKPKFSAQMLFQVLETAKSKEIGAPVIDKDPNWLKMKQAVTDLFIKNLGPDWQAKLKERKGDGSPMYRSPFRDGNAPEKREVEGYGPGVVFITASSLYAPGVIRQDKTTIMNPAELQGGDFARAEVHAYWYSTKGNQGVTFGLDNVQKVADGPKFSGRRKAEDVFDAVPEPTGAAAGAAPAAAGASTGDPLMG